MRDQLSVSLPRGLNNAVGERAKRDGRRPSDVVRLALQAYLPGSPNDGGRAWDALGGDFLTTCGAGAQARYAPPARPGPPPPIETFRSQ